MNCTVVCGVEIHFARRGEGIRTREARPRRGVIKPTSHEDQSVVLLRHSITTDKLERVTFGGVPTDSPERQRVTRGLDSATSSSAVVDPGGMPFIFVPQQDCLYVRATNRTR